MGKSQLALQLIDIRNKSGLGSALKFFTHLKKKFQVEFNYSYYARIEAGHALPSADFVQEICRGLDPEDREKLILAYCASVFPEYRHLFPLTAPASASIAPPPTIRKQKELTARQVATIGTSKHHYFVFLCLTLSRKGISIKELRPFIPAKSLPAVLDALLESGLIYVENELVLPTSVEIRYPKPESEKQKQLYILMDEWDKEFRHAFQFRATRRKMILKRISPRFLDQIVDQLKTIEGLVRLAEESNSQFNEKVIHFHYELFDGSLPG